MTDKQKRFCDEYLIDLNATQAAIRAGYSSKTAYSIGNENLKKPELQKYIEERKKDVQNNTELKKSDIIDALKSIGFAEIDKKTIRPKDAIRALEVISKMLGYDEPITDDLDKLDAVLEKLDCLDKKENSRETG